MTENDRLLYLCRRDVHEIAQTIDCVDLLREVFRLHASGATVLPEEAYLRWSNGSEQIRSLGMPGYIGGLFNSAGTKIINSNPSNIGRGIPRADGLTLIHDSLTGRISCVMEGAYLSAFRTAGVTLLATEVLGGPSVESVAILGAGVLAQFHLDGIAKHLHSVKQVFLYDTVPARALALKERTDSWKARDVAISVALSAEVAVRCADLVVPVTTTTTSYIPYEWLKAGCLVVNVSLDDVEPEVALRADLLVVDDWNLVQHDDKRLLGRMIRAGKIVGPNHGGQREAGVRAVDAEIGEIILGKKKVRRTPKDIVLMNPFGLAIEDVALGTQIYRLAKQRGFGVHLPR